MKLSTAIKEELVNSITHGVGAALGIAECALVLLVVGVMLEFFNIMLLHDLSQGTRIASFFFG